MKLLRYFAENTYMTFHMQPTHPLAQLAFFDQRGQLLRPRIPFSQRAAQVRQVLSSSEERNNNFSIDNRSACFSQQMLDIVVAHLNSVLNDAEVSIKIIDLRTNEPKVMVRVNKNEAELFFLVPAHQAKVSLAKIYSGRRGLGGLLLVSLYNIAQDLGKAKIDFSVTANNYPAMRFYYHLDFGRPVRETDRGRWEININQ
ncbi:MAG: hypothetical protein ABIE84_02785 [bacterium]